MTNIENEQGKIVDLFPTECNTLKQKLYCIFDRVSLTITPPFAANNDQEAIRNFTNLLNYSAVQLSRFPDDFVLLSCGDFITAITGSDKVKTRDFAYKLVTNNFVTIAEGKDYKKPDSNKYDELIEQVKQLSKDVSNANTVLMSKIGNVPKLTEDNAYFQSQIKNITERLEQLDTLYSEYSSFKIQNKKNNFFKKIFS